MSIGSHLPTLDKQPETVPLANALDNCQPKTTGSDLKGVSIASDAPGSPRPRAKNAVGVSRSVRDGLPPLDPNASVVIPEGQTQRPQCNFPWSAILNRKDCLPISEAKCLAQLQQALKELNRVVNIAGIDLVSDANEKKKIVCRTILMLNMYAAKLLVTNSDICENSKVSDPMDLVPPGERYDSDERLLDALDTALASLCSADLDELQKILQRSDQEKLLPKWAGRPNGTLLAVTPRDCLISFIKEEKKVHALKMGMYEMLTALCETDEIKGDLCARFRQQLIRCLANAMEYAGLGLDRPSPCVSKIRDELFSEKSYESNDGWVDAVHVMLSPLSLDGFDKLLKALQDDRFPLPVGVRDCLISYVRDEQRACPLKTALLAMEQRIVVRRHDESPCSKAAQEAFYRKKLTTYLLGGVCQVANDLAAQKMSRIHSTAWALPPDECYESNHDWLEAMQENLVDLPTERLTSLQGALQSIRLLPAEAKDCLISLVNEEQKTRNESMASVLSQSRLHVPRFTP